MAALNPTSKSCRWAELGSATEASPEVVRVIIALMMTCASSWGQRGGAVLAVGLWLGVMF